MHISCVFRVVTEPTSSASLTWFICQMDPYVSWVGSLNEIPVLLGVLANKDGVISIHGLDKTAKPRNRETVFRVNALKPYHLNINDRRYVRLRNV